jgi:5'-methylthioadenosine phosphorylase
MAEKVIGIIGGSGLYRMEGIEGLRKEKVKTPFGEPSDRHPMGRLEGRPIAFFTRHGKVIA